jgi:Ca2+-binding RTX toxin-like protein
MATINSAFFSSFDSNSSFLIDNDHGNLSTTAVFHGDGNSIQAGSGFDNIQIIGGTLGSDVHAGSGFSVIDGGTGADHLFGSTTGGTDYMIGGSGNDALTAGTHLDVMTGGSGTDTFIFNGGGGSHIITDFSVAQHDVISLAANNNGSGLTSDTLDSFLTSHATQVGANVIVDLGNGDTLQVNNASASDMIAHPGNYFTVH